MLIYLYGTDSYRRQRELKKLLDRYVEKKGVVMERFPIETGEHVVRLNNFLQGQSLFGDYKVAVAYPSGEFPKKEFKAILHAYADSQKTILIVVTENKLPKEYGILFKKPELVSACDAMDEVQMKAFIAREAAARNVQISAGTAATLCVAHGSNTWGVVTELEKLSLGGTMEQNHTSETFFNLLMRLPRKDIVALEWMLAANNPAAVFNVLAGYVGEQLKNKMADYDAAIKSGKLDYEEALTDLVIS